MDAKTQSEQSLEGRCFACTDETTRAQAIEQAFDYRGDVTVHTDDGQAIVGFVFDRRGKGAEAQVRIMPARGGGRQTIAAARITRIEFTGRDTAAGKSWENWLTRYATKKLRGENAQMDPDPGE